MGAFDDMMSSARGPGFIGTLVALLVVVGFGSLYFFVFDESLAGGGVTIESVIREQDKTIERLKGDVEYKQKGLEGIPELRRVAKEVDAVASQTRMGQGNIDGQTELVNRVTGEIEKVKVDLENYKQSYRNQVRGEAAGVTFPELKTLAGRVYTNVTVSRVDAVGMNFSHAEGSGRADFENLPESVREQFQYDPKEKERAMKAESSTVAAHNDAVNKAVAQEDAKTRETNARLKQEKYQKDSAELSTLQSQIAQYNDQIADAQREWEAEKRQVRAAGRGIVNSAVYQTRINNLNNQIRAASSRVSSLKSSLQN